MEGDYCVWEHILNDVPCQQAKQTARKRADDLAENADNALAEASVSDHSDLDSAVSMEDLSQL